MRRGTRLGHGHVVVSVDGDGINEDIVDAFDEAGPGVEKAGEEHGEKYGDNFSEGFLTRMRSRVSKRLAASLGGDKMGARAGDEAGESFVDRMSDKVRDMGDKIGSELGDRMASRPEQVRRGIDRAFSDDFADRVGDRLGARIASSMSESIDRQSATISEAIDRVLEGAVSRNRGSRRGIGERVGRLFGAGARNNALNLIGRTIGSMTSLIFKATTAASGMFRVFAKGFSQAAEGASLMQKLMAGFSATGAAASSGLARALASVVASGPIAIAVIFAVTAALTILVSVVSALTAAISALIATIASALVGVLAVGIGAFAALGAAIGLTTLAFTSMTDAQREALSSAFLPLKAAATGLGQIMLREMVPAFESWSRHLQTALTLMKPLAEVMGGAFARAGNILTEALSGPGIQLFITTLAQYLPRIVTNLSSAFGQFLNGVSGVFAALMPFVLRFSGYLSRTATDFARWASSARGQNSIVDFVRRALGSLESLWNFIKAVGSLISAVFFSKAGQNAGNNIFDSMASAVRRFTRYLSKEDRLENWFKDGEKFAKALGKTIETVSKILANLNDSKVVEVIWYLARGAEWAYKKWDALPDVIKGLINPLNLLLAPVNLLIEGFQRLLDLMGRTSGAAEQLGAGGGPLTSMLSNASTVFGGGPIIGPVDPNLGRADLDSLVSSGMSALNATSVDHGGFLEDPEEKAKKDKVKKEWKNPYIQFALSLLSEAPQLADEIRKAAQEARKVLRAAMVESAKGFADLILDVNKTFSDGVAEATRSTDASAIAASFQTTIDSMTTATNAAIDAANAEAQALVSEAEAARDQMVASAQSAVESAAQNLLNATSKKDAKAALKELRQAQKDLELAQKKGEGLVAQAFKSAARMLSTAKATQGQVDAASGILAQQSVLNLGVVRNLLNSIADTNATLADYAEARRVVAERLVEANQKLAEAIALRDNYGKSVSDAVRTFGSLMTASAKTLNGVQQALTAGDITDNLRDRLDRIKAFQDNLRILLAQGLSDAAYKQLVDAGVDSGSAYAQALVDGGQGSISEVNSLTEQISAAADGLGDAASDRLYQAGVAAAQGLVDGLLSLSAELDSAATQLGDAIANAIKRALGIASPSKVLFNMMRDDVGDGAVGGLDAAGDKVGAAAARLADLVAVSPEVAAYARSQGTEPTTDEVSGNGGNSNDPRFRDLIVHTPTENPEAVAMEVLNEVTGRL